MQRSLFLSEGRKSVKRWVAVETFLLMMAVLCEQELELHFGHVSLHRLARHHRYLGKQFHHTSRLPIVGPSIPPRRQAPGSHGRENEAGPLSPLDNLLALPELAHRRHSCRGW